MSTRVSTRVAVLAPVFLAMAATLLVAEDDTGTRQLAAATKELVQTGPVRLYENASPAVVGVTCRDAEGLQYFGTGTVIDADGLILTSTTVVPPEGRAVRVYLQGGRVLPAKAIEADPSFEFALLEIESTDEKRRYPSIRLGKSANTRLGHTVYTLGNAFASIQRDDQVVMAAGIVSGRYDLTDTRSQATYRGPVIETTAPVNGGMDGGPLLDSDGRLLGILGLNYSPNRWLGTAVPIDQLRPLLARHRPEFGASTPEPERAKPAPPARARPAADLVESDHSEAVFLGLNVEETEGRLRIVAVEPGSPAASAGLEAGWIVLELDGQQVKTLKRFGALVEAREAGIALVFTVRRDSQGADSSESGGAAEKREVTPWIRL